MQPRNRVVKPFGFLLILRVWMGIGLIFVVQSAWAQESAPKMPASAIYNKPILKKWGRGTFLGGYIDLEFKNTNGTGKDTTTFDQHRFIPFIYGQVHPRVHVAAEIEFEHGGLVSGDPSEETDGEITLEFATIDFTFTEQFNFRGGLILSPLGKFNLVHDSPVNELTDRPRVDRTILPTTLGEVGVGFFGTLYPSEVSALSYEIYVVNGFDGDLVNPAGFTDIRGGRGSAKSDNNREKSLVSRVAYSPFLGLEIGGSTHTGAYSDNGNDWLTIAAGDWTYTKGQFELLGEYARAWVQNGFNQWGFYAQGNYRFFHGLISPLPQSHFTTVVRYDFVDQSAGAVGGDDERITVGLNFRSIRLEVETKPSDNERIGLEKRLSLGS